MPKRDKRRKEGKTTELTREALCGMGLSDEQAETVMGAHTQAMDALRERESAATKAALYRALLREAGVDERRTDAILRVTDLTGVALQDGRLEDEAAVRESIARDWGDFIPATRTRGTRVESPPVSAGAGMTREQIMAIRDPSARQRAIAENIDRFR